MELWDKLKTIFETIPELAANISKLSDNKELQDQLEKAGYRTISLLNSSLFQRVLAVGNAFECHEDMMTHID